MSMTVANACTTSPPHHNTYSTPFGPCIALASAAPYAPEAGCIE